MIPKWSGIQKLHAWAFQSVSTLCACMPWIKGSEQGFFRVTSSKGKSIHKAHKNDTTCPSIKLLFWPYYVKVKRHSWFKSSVGTHQLTLTGLGVKLITHLTNSPIFLLSSFQEFRLTQYFWRSVLLLLLRECLRDDMRHVWLCMNELLSWCCWDWKFDEAELIRIKAICDCCLF